MLTTIDIDEELLETAHRINGVEDQAALIRKALRALVERESARRLARLGGSEPDLEPGFRRRT